jgi:putative tryptophan/tyrosine transport system substrate-binding protein
VRRRELIALIGGAAVAPSMLWPRAARAQQPVIGFLNSASAQAYARPLAAFRQGLSTAGYVEGRNVAIEYRWADGQYDRLPAMAAELVERQVAVIAANGPAVPTAKAATATIPIVFIAGFDPIELGLIASLNRPGGNLTGISILNAELGPKRLELLRELLPAATTVALLINPNNPSAATVSRELQAVARTIGLKIHVLHASSEAELDAAFATLGQLRASALAIGNDPFFNSRSARLAELASRHVMPAIYQYREFVAAGGLMSYGGSLTDSYRQAGLHRKDPGRRQAGRSAGAAIHQGRVDHQSPDREGARPHRSAAAARPRRRGDRMRCDEFITLLGAVAAVISHIFNISKDPVGLGLVASSRTSLL